MPLIKLTEVGFSELKKTILIGTESIIDVVPYKISDNKKDVFCTKIQSRGAMVQTHYVSESV